MMVRREERNKEAFFFSIFACIFGKGVVCFLGVINPNPNHTLYRQAAGAEEAAAQP